MSFLQPIALFGIFGCDSYFDPPPQSNEAPSRTLGSNEIPDKSQGKLLPYVQNSKMAHSPLRVLAISALAILMSRPITTDESSLINFASQKPEVVMLVMDRSSSMQKTFAGSSKTQLERGWKNLPNFPSHSQIVRSQ